MSEAEVIGIKRHCMGSNEYEQIGIMDNELKEILYQTERFIEAAKEGIPVITTDIFNNNDCE